MDDFSDYGLGDYSFDDIDYGSFDPVDYGAGSVSDFNQGYDFSDSSYASPSYDYYEPSYQESQGSFYNPSAMSSLYTPSSYSASPAYDQGMYTQGGFEGLGIGNPASYTPSSYTQSSPDEGGGFLASLDKLGSFMQSPGGQLMGQALGAGMGALGAMKQNKLNKKMSKAQAEELAKRKAEAMRYNEPLRLQYERQAVAAPVARRGESEFFSGNKLPSYFAEGGLARLRQYAKGRDIEREMQEIDGPTRAEVIIERAPSMGSQAEDYAAQAARLEAAALAEAKKRMKPKAKSFFSFKEGGCLPGYVEGGQSGQSDKVEARLSPGEYVMDADVVSALGDGNNNAGALKLDAMRAKIRTHKRGAPSSKIPPKAKSPLAYLKGAK